MFDSIIIRKSSPSQERIDIGLLAECMLFYNNVHVIAGLPMVQYMVKKLGLDLLERLINEQYIQFSFAPRGTGTLTIGESTPEEHFDFGTFAISKHDGALDFEGSFLNMLERGSGKRGKSRRVGRRILGKIEILDYDKVLPKNESISAIARNDLYNQEFLRNAVKTSLGYLAPEFILQQNWEFLAHPHKGGFTVNTNIDFTELNKNLSKEYFKDEKNRLRKAYLIGTIHKANEDLFLAAHYGKEILTLPITSSLINIKCSDIIRKTDKSIESRDLFQKLFISKIKTIRDTINSGEIGLADVLPIVNKSKKFKKWIKGKNNEDLIQDYCNEISSQSWLESFPSKILRFSLFTGAGILLNNPIAGVALGLGDNFIIDKLIKGWKPHHYINDVKKLLR